MTSTYLGALRDARTGRVYATYARDGLLERRHEVPVPCVRCQALQRRAYLDEGAAVANAISTYPCLNPSHI